MLTLYNSFLWMFFVCLVSGSSFESYNSYLSPMGYNTSKPPYNASNNSFNTVMGSSVLEQDTNGNSNSNFQGSATNAGPFMVHGPNYSPFKDSTTNLPGNNLLMTAGNYSPNSSNYTYNYDSGTSFDNLTRKSIDGHIKNQIDEQLLTKVSQMTLDRVATKLAEKQREHHMVSKELARSCHGLLNDREEFY